MATHDVTMEFELVNCDGNHRRWIFPAWPVRCAGVLKRKTKTLTPLAEARRSQDTAADCFPGILSLQAEGTSDGVTNSFPSPSSVQPAGLEQSLNQAGIPGSSRLAGGNPGLSASTSTFEKTSVFMIDVGRSACLVDTREWLQGGTRALDAVLGLSAGGGYRIARGDDRRKIGTWVVGPGLPLSPDLAAWTAENGSPRMGCGSVGFAVTPGGWSSEVESRGGEPDSDFNVDEEEESHSSEMGLDAPKDDSDTVTDIPKPRTSKIPKYIETTPAKSFVYTINSISFPPVAPHDFAAAHSTTVSIFSGQTLDHRSTISDFSDTVASASFRGDRKLLAAGDLTGIVDVFAALDLEPSISESSRVISRRHWHYSSNE
ncbi:U3 small nucleolar RNA-associated protein 15 [Striga asiatica]|uniref:U3 small nucleolar RNA-associated protein 15 n=1 Tax=Striga asiatica TaxID=4170 RepID=A0A5A7QPQ2_STRAF|nr:U3 small nucleolar RNA-associated protein 15 [Striga asiatica]